MIDYCRHCGRPIRKVNKLGPFHTGWEHPNGYNHCDPDYTSHDDRRAEPNE